MCQAARVPHESLQHARAAYGARAGDIVGGADDLRPPVRCRDRGDASADAHVGRGGLALEGAGVSHDGGETSKVTA